MLAETTPDALVLDIILPDGNGLDFLREMRDTGQAAPVLLLTSLIKKDERLEGLRTGGDDYITKPYDIDELRARVAAFLRRVKMDRESAPPNGHITRGPLTLDLVAQQAFLSGDNLLLAPKEFALLLFFVQNEGNTLTREAIYEAVWKQPLAGDAGALLMQMSRLKKKLEERGDRIVITAFRGEGYKLEIEA